MPWDRTRAFAVGEHARARGVDAPARVVASAKSWLSHAGIDRRGPTPPGRCRRRRREDLPRRSLVAVPGASRRSVGSRDRQGRPRLAFAQQEVVLTVPGVLRRGRARADRRGRAWPQDSSSHLAGGAAGGALRVGRRPGRRRLAQEVKRAASRSSSSTWAAARRTSRAIAVVEKDGALDARSGRRRRPHLARRRQHGPRPRPPIEP